MFKKIWRKIYKLLQTPFHFFCFIVLSSIFMLLFACADNIFMKSIPKSQKSLFKTDISNEIKINNYTWVCKNEKCLRFKATKNEERTSLRTCNMLCALPPIWPKPQKIIISNKISSSISTSLININISHNRPIESILKSASDIFINNLKMLIPPKYHQGNVLTKQKLAVTIAVNDRSVDKLKLNTDESYKLSVKYANNIICAVISSETFFGARHGLETLTQLIWYDEVKENLNILHNLEIDDFPVFPYRGLMVDTARNYFPVSKLKTVLDGMAATKLNIFHLHLTDSTSFPIVLPTVPILAQYGAYDSQKVYKPAEIKTLIKYARIRGIRVILEIDAPGHVQAGWTFGEELYNEKLIVCDNPDKLLGQLNPDNDFALDVLEAIYEDLLELGDEKELFHLGADEVNLNCWQGTNATKYYHNLDEFFADYINRMIDRLKIANKNEDIPNIILWSSSLMQSKYLKKLKSDVIIQYWLGDPKLFLESGHSVIYSTVGYWYLDCGFGSWKPDMASGVCDPYTPWQTFYNYRPWEIFRYRDKALGGEVCLWSEQVDEDSLETRIWPRSAAFAERVWSDPEQFDDYDVYMRLNNHRDRLLGRNLKVAAMWPEWCSQNPGKCGFIKEF